MIRVVVADHHRLFRTGLIRLLADVKSIEIVAEAESGEDLVACVRETSPHVVLMEISLPGIGGFEAARRIFRMELGTRIVMVTAAEHDPFPAQALRSGASGFVTKCATRDDVVNAVKYAYAGQRFVSDDVAQRLAFRTFDEPEGPFDSLSNREMQIMLMVINCQRVHDISENLHLSPKTVNSYRYRIFDKLKVGSDVELALLAVKHGVINPHLAAVGTA